MATVARATGKTAYDMLKTTVASLPTEWCSLKAWGKRVLAGRVGLEFRFAYRHIAFPFAITVGAIVLVLLLLMEIRNYRQRKALAGIERVS